VSSTIRRLAAAALVALTANGCSSDSEPSDGAGGSAGSGGGAGGTGGAAGGGGAGGVVDKAALSTDTFGDSLTDSYGRVDGTVLAIVAPSDTECPLVNDDHLVIEVIMQEEAYRMVVNIDDIGYAEHDAPLIGPPFAEGWHTNVTLEYPTDLGVHSNQFAAHSLEELVTIVSDQIEIGAPIAIYAVSSGGEYASSAHLIHRNNSQPDGAIALDPNAASAHYLLFRFDNQQF
jgi:hypothetical protein